MVTENKAWRVMIVLLVLAPILTGVAFAQRGDRGGGRGGGGRGGGDRGASVSRGVSPGGGQGRAAFQGGRGSFRGGGEVRSDRGRATQREPSPSFSRQPGRSGAREARRQVEQRSFYRGPDVSRPDGRQLDRATDRRRDFDRSRAFYRGRDFERQFDRSRDIDRRRDLDRRGDIDRREDFVRDRRFFGDRDLVRDRDRRFGDRDRDEWRRRVRDDWWQRHRRDLPFRWGWWDSFVGPRWPVFSPWRYHWWRDQPYYWWGFTTPGRLTTWLVFGWDRPYYWTYGPGGNIYYQNDVVFYDNRQYLPAEDYYRQVYELAHSVPAISEEEARTMEWSPLGVFAASHDSRPDDYRVIQLAVNKNGVLTGTYMNPQTNQPRPLQGMVDETSQRAAWAFADEPESPVVFETSIYNLTLPESTMMVHFGPRQADAQIWQLARLEQPASSDASQSDASAARPALP